MAKKSDVRYPLITRTYDRLSNEDLGPKLDTFVSGLSGNKYYTSIADKIDTYADKVTAFTAAQAEAMRTRSILDINARDGARDTVIAATIAISNAVEQVADGNLLMLLSTGLPLKKPAQPVQPGGPADVKLTDGAASGTLDIKLKRPKGSVVILARYTQELLTEKSEWTTVNSRVSRFSITGLDTATRYFVQLGIMNKGNNITWGDIIQSPLIS